MRGKNRCYVCFKKHHCVIYRSNEHITYFSDNFPEDVPYEFRWCCNCLRLANLLTILSFEKAIKNYSKHHSVVKSFFNIRIGKRLIKLMKVV